MSGSISVSGLLGGTAGQIDTTTLIAGLMKAAAVPQNQLQDKLTATSSQLSAYQGIASSLTAVQSAAKALLDPGAWTVTSVSSSSAAVAATSTAGAATGTTVFDVQQLATAQVSVVAADAGGNVLADPAAGFTLTGADGTAHTVTATSGSATDVARAVNAAGLGVRAAVVTTDQGAVLQLSSASTGAAHGFTVAGLDSAARTVVAAQDARIAVGGSSGYTVSSSSNTFTGVIPGVSFSVGAVATGVAVTVGSDPAAVGKAVQALVTAANSAHATLAAATAKGAVLQGAYDANTLASAIVDSVARGTGSGGSLATYGIDVDATGAMTFDATTFTAAFTADPQGTTTALSSSFVTSLNTTAAAAVDKTTGTVTQEVSGLTTVSKNLNDDISSWTSRLADMQAALESKFTTMQTALARLQSQQTYLTSMFDSITKNSSSSS